MSLCPVCDRTMCDHTAQERRQTEAEMMAELTRDEKVWLEEKGTVPDIEHKSYFGGMVQSLRGVMPDGKTAFTDGLVAPRLHPYDFGVAEHEEHITVTVGWLVINGKRYDVGETAIVKKGERIIIATAPTHSAYRCVYR